LKAPQSVGIQLLQNYGIKASDIEQAVEKELEIV